MILLQVSRTKTTCVRELTRNFILRTSLKNFHSTADKRCCLKFLYIPKCHSSKISSFKFVSYRSLSHGAHKTASDSTDRPSISSTSFYTEHPDVTNRSEEEIEEYRKEKRIIVRGRNVPKPITKFSELCLPGYLLEALGAENYAEPTPIQAQGWPVALSCRDMVGVSQTGSGKTLAYMLPAVVHAANLQSKKVFGQRAPKVLVLGPTRELIQQILQVSRSLLQVCNLRGACAYGGASRTPQLRSLQGADVCVATPGRLLDYIDNGEVNLQNCTYLVLDEADRMLDMGFEPQIRAVIEQIPTNRQTLMWSATWPTEIRSLAEDFLSDYIHITVGNTELVANPNIQQNIYVMEEEEKFGKFHSLLKDILANENSKVLVFVETKKKVDYLARTLMNKGLEAWGIHGDCSQHQRDRILKDFRRTTPSVLIATDIASRGLDISDIHHVINYDFPLNIEDYIHRIGRTARGSACGESHSFFKPENSGLLKELLSVLKKSNQQVNPDLLQMAESSNMMNKHHRPQRKFDNRRQPFYNRSYGKNRMYRNNSY